MMKNDLEKLNRYTIFLDGLTDELMRNILYMRQKTEGYYLQWKDEVYQRVQQSFLDIESVIKKLVTEIDEKNTILKGMKKKIETYLGGL